MGGVHRSISDVIGNSIGDWTVQLWKQQIRSYLRLCKQGRGGKRDIDCRCAFIWKYFSFKMVKIRLGHESKSNILSVEALYLVCMLTCLPFHDCYGYLLLTSALGEKMVCDCNIEVGWDLLLGHSYILVIMVTEWSRGVFVMWNY